MEWMLTITDNHPCMIPANGGSWQWWGNSSELHTNVVRVNDPRWAGTTASKIAVRNTRGRPGLKSCSAWMATTCWTQHTSGPALSLSKIIWMIHRRIGRVWSPWFHVVRPHQMNTLWYECHSSCLEVERCWVASQEHRAHSEAWQWKQYALGLSFSQTRWLIHIMEKWDYGRKPPSISKNIEDETCLNLPAWQRSKTHGPGNKVVAT